MKTSSLSKRTRLSQPKLWLCGILSALVIAGVVPTSSSASSTTQRASSIRTLTIRGWQRLAQGPSPIAHALSLGPKGDLWIGMYNGLCCEKLVRFDLHKGRFASGAVPVRGGFHVAVSPHDDIWLTLIGPGTWTIEEDRVLKGKVRSSTVRLPGPSAGSLLQGPVFDDTVAWYAAFHRTSPLGRPSLPKGYAALWSFQSNGRQQQEVKIRYPGPPAGVARGPDGSIWVAMPGRICGKWATIKGYPPEVVAYLCGNSSLIQYNPRTRRFRTDMLPAGWRLLGFPPNTMEGRSVAIAAGSDGSVWFAAAIRGHAALARFAHGRYHAFHVAATSQSSIWVDRNGAAWLWDAIEGTLTRVVPSTAKTSHIATHGSDVLWDAQGTPWLIEFADR